MSQQDSKDIKPKLMEQVRYTLRRNNYAMRTEDAYVGWIVRFINFHNARHPQDMDTPEIEAFLNHLVDQNVTASTQNQAFSALIFLYKRVLLKELQSPIKAMRAKGPERLPTVLTRNEVQRVINALSSSHQLIVSLLYGSGIRLMECLRLRVKDLDFEQHQLIVRSGKGNKDRMTMLPDSVQIPLQNHLKGVKAMPEKDIAKGHGAVYLPNALHKEISQR